MLNNHTFKEMKEYFGSHGTKGYYIRTNAEATKLWAEEIKRQPESNDGIQPLGLVHWMTLEKPGDRPTAQQIGNTLFDFQSQQAIYGICCYVDGNTQSSYIGSVSSYIDKNDSSSKLQTPFLQTAIPSRRRPGSELAGSKAEIVRVLRLIH